MWEAISFAGGMVVLMLLYAILGHVFELPEIVMKYLRGKSQQPDGEAARRPGRAGGTHPGGRAGTRENRTEGRLAGHAGVLGG